MGRPRNGQVYLKKGKFHVRFQGDSMSTDLGTTSKSIAENRLKEVVRMRERRGESSIVSPIPVQNAAKPDPYTSGGTAPAGPTTGDALGQWYAGESSFERSDGSNGSGTLLGGGPGPETKSTDYVADLLSVPPGNPDQSLQTSGLSWEQPKPTLTTAEKEKLHGLMAGVVVRVNVLLLGLGVNIFGRIPAEPAPEDTDLLNKAWQLQLTEWFANTEIKPAILIIAASAGLGVGMYANGEKKQPKVPPPATENVDGTRAK